MSTLTELTATWRKIELALEETEGEVTPEIESQLAQFNLDEADKVDGYLHVIRDLRDRAALAARQARELTERATDLEHRAGWLQYRLEEHMAARGLRRIEGNVRRAQYQRSGSAPIELTVEGPERLPPAFQRVTVEANRKELGEALTHEDHPLHAMAQAYARFGARRETLRFY